MTTEDDFHALLDANPEDWMTRLIFADFLEERGDERAEGYRALGMWKVYPERHDKTELFFCYWKQFGGESTLSEDWFLLITPSRGNPSPDSYMRSRSTRQELEDAAALAFASLPPSRKAELLSALHAAAH